MPDLKNSPQDGLSKPGRFESAAAGTCIHMNSAALLDAINLALQNRQPLSVVSVGQTEAFVMAQYTIYNEQEFMSHREAYNANQGAQSGFLHRGVRFPNLPARDAAVEAVRKADIIGYNLVEPWARDFTEKVLAAYQIKPRAIFEANLRRVFMFSQKERFEAMLTGRRVLLIGSLAGEAQSALELRYKKRLGLTIAGAIPIYEFEEIPLVKKKIAAYKFDLCLLGAGVNAVILAAHIAEKHDKVAFDIGWGIKALIDGEVVRDSFINEVIGLDNLLHM